jgi:transposase-like protein
MTKKFITYTAEFKAKVIKELIKNEQTQAELAAKYGITTKSIQNWHSEFQDGIEAIFAKGKLEKAHKDELKQQENKLNDAYREIGSLTTQINWLKKKCIEFNVKH